MPVKPAPQPLQSRAESNWAPQVLQLAPDHWLRHVHRHPLNVSPDTCDAWSLQSLYVHCRVQFG
jgi:hypothetical protein